MLADDHALVDFDPGGNEEHSPILQPVEGVCGSGAVAVGNERAARPLRDLTLVRHVTVKERIHHDGAARLSQHLAAQADEATAGNTELQTLAAVAMIVHLQHLPAPGPQTLDDSTDKIVGNVNGEMLDRLHYFAIHCLGDNLGPAYHELKPFATHHLDQNGQLQLSAAQNLEAVGTSGLLHTNEAVGGQFLVQALAQITGGNKLSFPACHGRVVDGKLHGDGGLVDDNQGQGCRIFNAGDGLAYGDAGDPGDGDDVPDLGRVGVGTLQSVERE